ncbi:MAG: sigma-70 family RNA polymerase sigma factor [Gemmataceae bacterium]
MNAGDKSIIVQEIARHQTRLRALVRCLLVRASDVDDLVQEINVVLRNKADDFEPGTDFWAWASQIARFQALNQIRKYERERLVFDVEIIERLAEVAQTRLGNLDQRREALQECLNQLPPAQRQLIDLRYASSQTIESIASSISRPAGSVRQILYRIRLALLSCIENKLALQGES